MNKNNNNDDSDNYNDSDNNSEAPLPNFDKLAEFSTWRCATICNFRKSK